MRYLNHDSGEATTLKNSQVLGDDSPLEFDADGRAGPLDDARAEKIAAMHRHVTLGERARQSDETDENADEAETDGFDAEAFVDRTPMEDVVADIESGEYDEHLDAIVNAAERAGVEDAVDARQE